VLDRRSGKREAPLLLPSISLEIGNSRLRGIGLPVKLHGHCKWWALDVALAQFRLLDVGGALLLVMRRCRERSPTDRAVRSSCDLPLRRVADSSARGLCRAGIWQR